MVRFDCFLARSALLEQTRPRMPALQRDVNTEVRHGDASSPWNFSFCFSDNFHHMADSMTMSLRLVILLLVSFSLAAAAESRRWQTDSDGIMNGEYVSSEGSLVRIRRDHDGKVGAYPMDGLSRTDRAYVADLKAAETAAGVVEEESENFTIALTVDLDLRKPAARASLANRVTGLLGNVFILAAAIVLYSVTYTICLHLTAKFFHEDPHFVDAIKAVVFLWIFSVLALIGSTFLSSIGAGAVGDWLGGMCFPIAGVVAINQAYEDGYLAAIGLLFFSAIFSTITFAVVCAFLAFVI